MSQAFDPDNRELILDALNDPDPSNPVNDAVTERVQQYLQEISDMADTDGALPVPLVIDKPATALDDIALRLATQSINDEFSEGITLKWRDA